MTGDEVPLAGGNVSAGVVRVGDTVRRPAGPWTPAVHALLTHLHDAGFPGAPRPHGLDSLGREVLDFVPGVAAWPDHFDRLDGDLALRRAARLIRDFHDAVAGFAPLSADPAVARADAGRRLRVIADAYGLSERERLSIVPLLTRRTRAMHDFLAAQAARGTQPWTRLWHAGHGEVWRADADYIAQRSGEWHRALLD